MTVSKVIRRESESRAVRYFREMEHGVISISGSGKQGKSTSLHYMAEEFWPDKSKILYDIPGVDSSIFPNYEAASTPDEVPPDTVCIIEDINRVFGSRGSGNNADLQRWIGCISHKGIILMFTSQNLADTDVALFRSQDLIEVHKRMWDTDIQFERPEFQLIQSQANAEIESAVATFPDVDRRSWSYVPRFNEVLALGVCDWWTRDHSHMLRDVRVCIPKKLRGLD